LINRSGHHQHHHLVMFSYFLIWCHKNPMDLYGWWFAMLNCLRLCYSLNLETCLMDKASTNSWVDLTSMNIGHHDIPLFRYLSHWYPNYIYIHMHIIYIHKVLHPYVFWLNGFNISWPSILWCMGPGHGATCWSKLRTSSRDILLQCRPSPGASESAPERATGGPVGLVSSMGVPWGIPLFWMVKNVKKWQSEHDMDENWGYPKKPKKPPYGKQLYIFVHMNLLQYWGVQKNRQPGSMSCLICSWDLRSQSFLRDLKQILRPFGSWGKDVPRDVESFGRTTNGLCVILDGWYGWVYHIPFCFFFEGGTLLMAVAWSPIMLSETTSWVLGLRHTGNAQQPKKGHNL
jgi:hypothetical protein